MFILGRQQREFLGREVIPRLDKSVVPLFINSHHGEPEAIGSGTLIDVSGRCFLITAAHVLDSPADQPIYFILGNQTPAVCISDLPIAQSKMPLGGWLKDVHCVDIAVCEIPVGVLGTEGLIHPWPATCLAPGIIHHAERHSFAVVGFPISWCKATRYNRPMNYNFTIKAKPFSARLVGAMPEKYQATGFKRERNLLLKYEQLTDLATGIKRAPPKLYGVSGGAVWRLPSSRVASHYQCQLMAIVTNIDQENKCVIAISVLFVRRLLRKCFGVEISQ